jgi:uncharacterized protein YecE (DUF72 family)
MAPGRLYAGTSGFAYPGWAPAFYPAGSRPAGLLREYGQRLPAVELNNTFYQQPRPERVAAWLADTPDHFRFTAKAQRGGSMRAFGSAAEQTVTWLTGPYRAFGERLGCMLFRVPANVRRDDARLGALLAAWPADLPVALEFKHASWHADEVFELLRGRRVTLCATDLDDGAPPDLRLTGRFIYLRLRRASYTDAELAAWSDRLVPFLDDGRDCYVFLRHDESGQSALSAAMLGKLVASRLDLG